MNEPKPFTVLSDERIRWWQRQKLLIESTPFVGDFLVTIAARDIELNAWKTAFGSQQLTHAIAQRDTDRKRIKEMEGVLKQAAKIIDACKFSVNSKDGSGNFNMEYKWDHKIRKHDPEGWFKQYRQALDEDYPSPQFEPIPPIIIKCGKCGFKYKGNQCPQCQVIEGGKQ